MGMKSLGYKTARAIVAREDIFLLISACKLKGFKIDHFDTLPSSYPQYTTDRLKMQDFLAFLKDL
jgi:hypothetical protein